MRDRTFSAILGGMNRGLPEMLLALERVTNLDSPSNEKKCVDRLANVLAEMWQECGCVCTIIPQKLHGNHLKVEWGSGDEQLLVLCHMDTVWGKGETARRPFKIERAKAYGPVCNEDP